MDTTTFGLGVDYAVTSKMQLGLDFSSVSGSQDSRNYSFNWRWILGPYMSLISTGSYRDAQEEDWQISTQLNASYNVLLLFLPLSAGCISHGSQQSFVRQDVDFGYIKSVAVLPFENNTSDQYVAGRLRDITTTHILAKRFFDVVEKGVVDTAMREESLSPTTPLGETALKRLGQRLGVEAFVIGIVDHSGEGRKGNFIYPEITVTLRLVDATSAKILWQATGSKNGDSTLGRLFGTLPGDQFQVSTELLDELLSTLPSA